MRAVSDEPDLGAGHRHFDRAGDPSPPWLIGGRALPRHPGSFIGIDSHIDSYMGWNLLLPVFAAANPGAAIGQPIGAAAGGLALGLDRGVVDISVGSATNPLVSPDYKTGLAFAINGGSPDLGGPQDCCAEGKF